MTGVWNVSDSKREWVPKYISIDCHTPIEAPYASIQTMKLGDADGGRRPELSPGDTENQTTIWTGYDANRPA